MTFIANRRVEWLGQIYELDNIESVIRKYVADVAAVINNYMEGQELDIGLAGGAGVYMLGNLLMLKKKLAVVDGPESANAVGYWQYGILKQED